MRAAHDVYGPVGEVPGEVGLLGVLRGGYESDALDEDYPGVGVEHLLVGLLVAREVRFVVLPVAGDVLPEPLPELVGAFVLGVEVHPKRPDLRPDQVVGAGRADLREFLRVAPADEGEDVFRGVIHPQYLVRGLVRARRERPAQRGKDRGEQSFPPVRRRRFDLPAAEGLTGPARDELRGPVYGLDGAAVALLVGIAPGDQTVLGQEDEPRVRVALYGLANLLAERETGADVRDPDRLLPEALACQPLAAFCAADHVDRVGVRVVDLRVGHESVQQRLYGAPRHVWLELATREVVHHLLVAHLLAVFEREYLAELEPGKLPGLYGRQVTTGALDPEDVDLPPGMVAFSGLGRGVAAPVVGHRAVRAEQVGAVGQGFELGEALGPSPIPQVLRHARRLGLHVCSFRSSPASDLDYVCAPLAAVITLGTGSTGRSRRHSADRSSRNESPRASDEGP